MNKDVLFSSAKADWETPLDFYRQLDDEFKFDLDAAANRANHKAPHWFGPGGWAEDALTVNWTDWGHKSIWCNPPYGRGIGEWVAKGYNAAGDGATVVMLLPARTDTKWFHNYCIFGDLRFIKGRLRFVGAPASAPFPSMLVVFRPTVQQPYSWIELR